MAIPDPLTTGVALASTLQAAKQVQDFIAAVTGHPGETIGTILGNMFQRRTANAETVIGKAHFTLLNIGVPPGPVPLKILQPLIEGASLEEEESMQERWANLLATAANPNEDEIPPSFTSILAELSPRAARFLDSIYDLVAASVPKETKDETVAFGKPLNRGELLNSHITTSPAVMYFLLDLDDLLRLRLLESEAPPLDRDEFLAGAPVGEEDSTIFRLTSLAYFFVRACRLPQNRGEIPRFT
jgi:hypothetical protein